MFLVGLVRTPIILTLAIRQMTIKSIDSYYETADLALATALSLWVPIDVIDRSDPKQALFYFVRTSEQENLVELYWRKELLIEPQSFFNQLRNVKARLYERR